MTNYHICSLGKTDKKKFTPKPYIFGKFTRLFQKSITISTIDPRVYEFYNSAAEINEERRNQLFSRKSRLIHPFSCFRFYYNIFLCVVLLVANIHLPLYASFTLYYQNGSSTIADLVLKILCLLDIIMTFFTGYIDDNRKTIITEGRQVAKRYLLNGWLVIDLLSSIPHRSTAILGFLKLARLKTCFDILDSIASCDSFELHIGRSLLLTSLVLHFCACLLEFGSKIKVGYCMCFYKALAALLSIDINYIPDCCVESAILALISIYGKIYMTYIAVGIMHEVWDQNRLETKYHSVIGEVESLMTARRINNTQRIKILRLYEFKFRARYFNESRVEALLPLRLTSEIHQSVSRKSNGLALLIAEFPGDIWRQMKIEIYAGGDVIIHAGTVGDRMYVLASGTVSVITSSGKEICHLTDGAYFGEISLIVPDSTRIANVVALEPCEIYVIERAEFKKSFAGKPLLLEKMLKIAQRRIEEANKIEEVLIKCAENK